MLAGYENIVIATKISTVKADYNMKWEFSLAFRKIGTFVAGSSSEIAQNVFMPMCDLFDHIVSLPLHLYPSPSFSLSF